MKKKFYLQAYRNLTKKCGNLTEFHTQKKSYSFEKEKKRRSKQMLNEMKMRFPEKNERKLNKNSFFRQFYFKFNIKW